MGRGGLEKREGGGSADFENLGFAAQKHFPFTFSIFSQTPF
jgi:hypothetical protein